MITKSILNNFDLFKFSNNFLINFKNILSFYRLYSNKKSLIY